MLSLKPDYSKRIYGLDVFRAIAILIVVTSHGWFILQPPLDAFPWIKLPDGVDLFFVLSGFLIGSMLLKQLETQKQFTGLDLLTFWKRRWFRTIPAYYLVLILNYIFVKHQYSDGDLNQFGLKFFVFIQNFNSPLIGFFWESWSLSVEEWFYLILPVICLGALKFLSPKKAFLLAALLLIIAPLLYRISISGVELDKFNWEITFRKIVLTRLDAIGFGVLAAWLYFYFPKSWAKARVPLFLLGLTATFALLYTPIDPTSFFFQTTYFTLVPFFMALLLPFANSIKSFRTPVGKVFTHISLISYSMYLINLALVASVLQKHFPITGFNDGVLKYAIYWAIVIVGSTILYKFYEKPMMELRDKI